MGGEDKIFADLGGIPVLARTLLALDRCERIDEIIIAARSESIVDAGRLCKDFGITKPTRIVVGGPTRAESVYLASLEASRDAQLFAVHDGARPLVTDAVICAALDMAEKTGAAAPAVPVKDTIKRAADGVVTETPDREGLFAVQTPQAFDASLLKAALQAAIEAGAEVTDDCGAVERLGKKVYLSEGSYENIKITTPEDLAAAEAILERRGNA
jgi:2-C-methyl-D-erythritol 4-phosphate cytidylyltransferase